VSLGSLAVAAGVHPGLGGRVGRTCRAWVSLVTLPEDVVKDGELVGQGKVSVAGLLVSWLGSCGWGCWCCAFVGLGMLVLCVCRLGDAGVVRLSAWGCWCCALRGLAVWAVWPTAWSVAWYYYMV
jgi:hypothetical protein